MIRVRLAARKLQFPILIFQFAISNFKFRIYTYQINELRQPEAQLDQHRVRVVAHRPDEAVVVAQEIVVEPLGVRIGLHRLAEEQQDQEQAQQLAVPPQRPQGQQLGQSAGAYAAASHGDVTGMEARRP